jgi:AIPR protein
MVDRSREETASLSTAEQEAFFVSKYYLRRYKPAHDDLLSGIVDGSRDGGLDSVYLFANGHCVRDETDLAALGAYVQLDLIFIQVKNASGFGEAAIDKLIINVPELLNFNRDEKLLSTRFNPKVLEVTRRFLRAYRSLEMPHLSIYFVFASLRATNLHENVKQRGEKLRDVLKDCFKASQPKVKFLDASAVADMARERPLTIRKLALSENPISTDTTGGYIGVVNLREYQAFITDRDGQLDAGLFEANVRDYERATDVNRAIQKTLEHDESGIDFWWLNNGVTIVADKVQCAGKFLELESPQIVNGLQTSHEIYQCAQEGGLKSEMRSVLVKVIQADRDEVKDRIIRATNSQTTLAISSLRATDKVQRQIEEYLRSRDLFYERRKNHYYNQTISLDQLVSIDEMGQAVLSITAQFPHIARGQITRVFEHEIYNLAFSKDHPIAMYLNAIRILRRCMQFLRETQNREWENFVYHLAMASSIALTRKNVPNASDIALLEAVPDNELLGELLKIVQDSFANISRRRGEVLFERVAKLEDATEELKNRLRKHLSSTRRT